MSKAIIIGGGIVGLSSAYYLKKAGWQVEVLEKSDLTDNCSFGNMGYLSPSHIIPMAAPGMVEQGIWWMFDRKSPFYIRPELSWRLLRWGWQFWKHATRQHVERSCRPLAELLLFSRVLYFEWVKEEPLNIELKKNGCIIWYQTAKKAEDEIQAARLAEKIGLNVQFIASREQARSIEPDMDLQVAGGVLYQDDAHLHPTQLMQQLPHVLEKMGVHIHRNTAVEQLEHKNGKIQRLWAGGHAHDADVFVVAAGSWSPQIAQLAGDSLLLMPAKGYSMDIPRPSLQLRYPCIFKEAKVALTPFDHALRIGSTLEIGKINSEILYHRVRGILDAVPKYMPAWLNDAGFCQLFDAQYLKNHLRERVWFGFRPMSPDGLPYIDFSPRLSNVIYATGHAMIGLSMGAGTGKLVAELAEGKPTSIRIDAFQLGRF